MLRGFTKAPKEQGGEEAGGNPNPHSQPFRAGTSEPSTMCRRCEESDAETVVVVHPDPNVDAEAAEQPVLVETV